MPETDSAARRRRAKVGLPAEAPAKARSRRKNATVERRKASVRFAVQAQRTRRASPARLTRAERRDKDKKMRLSALRPPLDWVGETEANPRAHPRAGTRRRELFDIVRWDDAATVRAGEDEQLRSPSCVETHRAPFSYGPTCARVVLRCSSA